MRMDPELEGVWSVTCFVVAKSHRGTGLTYELAAATVEHGERMGAPVMEGYPMEPAPGQAGHLGRGLGRPAPGLPRAGYEVVAAPTLRRRVVRHHLAGARPPTAT